MPTPRFARAGATARNRIYAPADGAIASFDLHPGDMLGVNQTAAILDTFADPVCYVYASQRDLARFERADSIRVSSDSGAGDFRARSRPTIARAQFTPQNVETADQRAELVYGIKVRIHDPEHKLLDGSTVTVDVP